MNEIKTIVEDLPIDSVIPSDFKPQIQRRKRFTDEAIEAFSLKILDSNGIINPITVRKIGDKWQIVAGERRWRGTVKAGLKTIPAVIKEIDDETAYKIQLQENLEREDLHPLDEALTYQDIKEHYKYDDEQLALHVGKPLEYVQTRLKLLKLNKKVLEEFEAENLLLGHALEIGKYPLDSQVDIMELAFVFHGDNQGLRSVKNFRENIQERFMLRLDKAKFSKDATNLGEIACVKCPKQTGANQNMFEQISPKKACCLDPKCYAKKDEINILRKREAAVVEKFGVDPNDTEAIAAKLSKIPIISNEYWIADKDKPKEKYIGYYDFKEIKAKKDECKFARPGIFFNGARRGEMIDFCDSSKCEKHSSSSSLSKKELTEEEREKELTIKRNRREEILDSKVGEPVRQTVLKEAVKNFDAKRTIFNSPKSKQFLDEWLIRTWELQCEFSTRTADFIRETLNVKGFGTSLWRNHREDVEKLSDDKKSQLLFLLLTAYKGEISEGSWKDQTEILEIAEDYGINYKLLDAKERLQHISKKNLPVYKEYLDAVESGDLKPKLPRFFSPDYVPPKKK